MTFPMKISQAYQPFTNGRPKTSLLQFLEELAMPTSEKRSNADILILSGAGTVNMFKPSTSKSFAAFTQNVFLSYIEKQFDNAAE